MQNINIIILLDVEKSFDEVSYPSWSIAPKETNNWRNIAQHTAGYVQET